MLSLSTRSSFLLEPVTHRNCADNYPRGRKLLLQMLPEMRLKLAAVQCRAIPGLTDILDVLAGNRICNSIRLCPQHAGIQQCHALDLIRQDLQPADVQNLGAPACYADEITLRLDNVAGVVPAIDEWIRCIQVTKHPVL